MARPCAYCNPYRNFLPTGEDKLAGTTFTRGSNTPTPTPAVLCAPNPAPAIALFSDNKLFKQFMKVYLEAQVPGQIEMDSKPRKKTLRARFPNLYYSNVHMNCYQFCQQCKDPFEIVGAKKLNRILFVALFLRGLVTQQWLQHK